jgi:putative heme-binding domain-containing protein
MRAFLFLSLSCICLSTVQAAQPSKFQALFNGHDLTGWQGDPQFWRVEGGVIVGQTQQAGQLKQNQFLIWRGGVLKDFILRAKIQVTGNNTGIQYRSEELPKPAEWALRGFQCDIHPEAKYNGMLYEEKARGILCQNGQSVVADPAGIQWLVAERELVKVDTAEWHEYHVIARGNKLIHKVDGRITAEFVDHETRGGKRREGLLGLQLHQGPAMTVRIKDVLLQTLPNAPRVSFEKNPLPSDAQQIEKPVAPAKAKSKKGPPAKPAAPAKDPNEGKAIGENQATPVSRIKVPKDFRVELLYSVPGGEQGSWVALCHDDKGRLYASDQYGDLYRFKAPAPGQVLSPQDVQKVPINLRAINGMVFAFGALYVGVNDYEKKIPSGLYRIKDTDQNDQFDRVELLRAIDSSGDHGVHAVLSTPDGKGLYLVTGNNAVLTQTVPHSPVPKIWGDDHLLPRMPDGRGHNRHVLAPGGIIYRVDPEGKNFEIFTSGLRNVYDAALNHDGELFTYDADMEYDFNTSWYRPTRINHVVSGAEYGWRNGAGKYPEFYADNLPAVLNIGPGSPTGMTFGYGAKFPQKYQRALFALDWSWGKLYAVHLQESGSSYRATKEEFLTGSPLPLTDAIVLPQDGALYFAIGGRRVQSGLYRVTYTGTESTASVEATPQITPARQLRHELEAWHGKQDPQALELAWAQLGHPDRFIRWSARTILEHQPLASWRERALKESDIGRQLEALLALARAGGVCPSHRAPEHQVDAMLGDELMAALLKLDFSALNPEQQLAHVRIAEIVLHRFAPIRPEQQQALIAQLDPAFPAARDELNWLLAETLVYLQAPNTAAKALKLISEASAQEPQIELARSLRMLKAGWTPELRTAQLEWLLKATNFRGGASFSKFIEFIRNDSLATFTEAELTQHAALIAKKPEVKSAIENVGALFTGRTPKNWTLEELSAAAERTDMKTRNLQRGRQMFGAAACAACHRFGNSGGMTGPDLTGAGGRYSPRDLLDQVIHPSKEINEQFAPIVVTKTNGDLISGVVVNLHGDRVILNTDASDPNQCVNIDRKEVKSIEPSKVSPMPPMLLSMLKEEEILDLVAYILSGNAAP